MEKLNIQEAVLLLGQQLVNKLGLEPGSDTFGRWMCHYIADQMVKAENSEGEVKEAAQQKCFETILQFWRHRWQLPSGERPFENFERILFLIERLDPESRRNFYYHQLPERNNLVVDIDDEQAKWIKFAESVDKSARVCIEFAIDRCTELAKDSETENWLKYGSLAESGLDSQAIAKLTNIDLNSFLDAYENDDEVSQQTTEEINKKYAVEKINLRIQHLEQLSKANNAIVKGLKAKLKKISN